MEGRGWPKGVTRTAPTYSICATNYNSERRLRESLESIINQIDSSFEIVIVDSMSTDDSKEILKHYSDEGAIKLFRVHCSRGKGRQIAFEKCSGKYVISNLDFDDVFKPRLRELLTKYHNACEGYLLWARSLDSRSFWGEEGFMVAPRTLIARTGGWRDLQIGEDWELARRVAAVGSYKWSYFKLMEDINPHPERNTAFGKMKYRYVRYRDLMRCGRAVFTNGERISLGQRVSLLAAKVSLPFCESYESGDPQDFAPHSPEYFIDLGEGLAPGRF